MQFPPDEADGWAVLHQMIQIDWQALSLIDAGEREQIVLGFSSLLTEHAKLSSNGQSAAFHLLGHKGPLCLIHFRPSFDLCAQIELDIFRLPLAKYLKIQDSFVSIIELGMYHVSKKIVEQLQEQGLKPYSDEWNQAWEEKMKSHREALHERCFCEIPDMRYFCFYPMNKRRGEKFNWYMESIQKRAEWMMEHGMTGRRFGGKVKQIISGAIGFDDWEWGVDLFTDDPIAIKRLVYEMRFDDASAMFGEFGEFYFGVRLTPSELSEYFSGKIPELSKYSTPVELKQGKGSSY